MTLAELKKSYEIYKDLKEKSDQLDEMWNDDPANEKIAQRWDKAYIAEREQAQILARKIVIFTKKQIDFKTALQIINKKPLELAALIERIA